MNPKNMASYVSSILQITILYTSVISLAINQRYIPILNDNPCVNTCPKYNNSVCYNKVCYCGINYIWNNITSECQFNICLNDIECRDYDPNRYCFKGDCKCSPHTEETTFGPYLCNYNPPPNYHFLWFLALLPAIILVIYCCYVRRGKNKKMALRIETNFDRNILYNPNNDQLYTITPLQSTSYARPQTQNISTVSQMAEYSEPTLMVPSHNRNVNQGYYEQTQSFAVTPYPPPYSTHDPLQMPRETDNAQQYCFNPQHVYTKQPL
jgi:hypothetical protein